MNQRRSFYRKLGYVLAIAVLCFPVYELGHPASVDSSGHRAPGGYLAQLRDDEKYRMSEASLGDVDPTGSTIELASLGLNGVAVLLLWESAHNYQMKEDWSSYSAVLEQIIRLEPHFWSVWDFQGHNLSYNISVEFDDYRDRFAWVMKGIDFLKRGMQFNSTDPRFLARIGWFYDNKIGKADEHVQYRQLFKKQQDDKNEKPNDNYLMAYEWYIRAQNLVDSGRPLRVYISGEQEKLRNKAGERAPSPLLFHDEPADVADPLRRNDGRRRHVRRTSQRGLGKCTTRMEPVCHPRSFDRLQLFGAIAGFGTGAQGDGRFEAATGNAVAGPNGKNSSGEAGKAQRRRTQSTGEKPERATPEESNLAGTADYKTKATWEEVADQAPEAVRPKARELGRRNC